jgi:hypothetical protein
VKKIVLLITLLVLASCNNGGVVGTVDETDTGIGAVVYDTDLAPAQGAKVELFAVADTTQRPVMVSQADAQGRYSFADVPQGLYNVVITKGASVAYLDSVTLGAGATLADDTLEYAQQLVGRVGVEPNHDPRTVTVQALGTMHYSNVTADGSFGFKGVASGNYVLRLTSTLPGYTPTYVAVHIQPISSTTNGIALLDTLWLTYTALPVVTGLVSTFDTLKGIVHLSWEPSGYRDMQDYVVYRDLASAVILSQQPLMTTRDSFINDTIVQPLFGEMAPGAYRYRVALRGNDQVIGPTYKYVDQQVVGSQSVRTAITLSARGAVVVDTLVGSVRDSIALKVGAHNPTRLLRSLLVVDGGDTLLQRTMQGAVGTLADSCKLWTGASLGERKLVCSSEDNGGVVWHDTVVVRVEADVPQVRHVSGEVYLNEPSTLHFALEDGYGRVVSADWRLDGQSGWQPLDVVQPSCTFELSQELSDSVGIRIRAVDEDNNSVEQRIVFATTMAWEEVALPAGIALRRPGQSRHLLKYHDELYLFAHDGREHPLLYRMVSSGGWEQMSEPPLCPDVQPVVFNGKVWLAKSIYPALVGSDTMVVDSVRLYSSDLVQGWDSLTLPMSRISGREGLEQPAVFMGSWQGQLWVGRSNIMYNYGEKVGGCLRASNDGVNWSIEEGPWKLAMSNSHYGYRSVAQDDMLYVAGVYVGPANAIGPLNTKPVLPHLSRGTTLHNAVSFIEPTHALVGYYIESEPRIFVFRGRVCMIVQVLPTTSTLSSLMVYLDGDGQWRQCGTIPAEQFAICGVEHDSALYIYNENGKLLVAR